MGAVRRDSLEPANCDTKNRFADKGTVAIAIAGGSYYWDPLSSTRMVSKLL